MDVAKHLTQIVHANELLDVAAWYSLDVDVNFRSLCFAGHDATEKTLQFDSETQTFSCVNPECPVHGNVIDLVQAP